MPKVLVSLVLYNSLQRHSEQALKRAITSVLEQKISGTQQQLQILVIDNASTDGGGEFIQKTFPQILLHKSPINLGFSGGHNLAVKQMLEADFEYLLMINPDLRLAQDCLSKMLECFSINPTIGAVTPKIIQADLALEPLPDNLIDAAGMEITKDLRHFDRGSGQSAEYYNSSEFVFGGTGACLLLRRNFIEDLLLPTLRRNNDLNKVYSGLADDSRPQLLDEAFLAYREDADLSWRAQLFGWQYFYCSDAVAFHRRVVRHDNRSEISPELNALGVKNRFLLQVNNLGVEVLAKCLWRGVIFRNIVVLAAVLITERSSLSAILSFLRLLPRALEVRSYVRSRVGTGDRRQLEILKSYFKD
jgi:GT2 family glycosyltransferase